MASPRCSVGGSIAGSLAGSLGSTRKVTSSDFAAQIKRLEMEGEKLRNSSKFIPSSSGTAMASSSFNSTSLDLEVSQATAPLNVSSLDALADISTETKTISQLRIQLENQKREAEDFQKKLLHGSPGGLTKTAPSFDYHVPPVSSSLARRTLDIPSSTRSYNYLPQSHLEKALQQSQESVQDLRRRVVQANETMEDQKRQFTNTIEELKGKLQETVTGRDSLIEMRKKEAVCQDTLVKKLQNTLQQLHTANQDQEQTIADITTKLEGQQQDVTSLDNIIGQLRLVLTNMEKRRGRVFYESEPVPHQTPSMLIHTLERMIEEFEGEISTRSSKITQLENDLEQVKKSSQGRSQDLISQHQDRLQSLSEEHEKQLEAAADRAANARKQASGLQTQVIMLQDQIANLEKIKDEEVKALEVKLQETKYEIDNERRDWRERKNSFEYGLDEVQKELTDMRSERDEAIRNMAAWESRVSHYETSIERLQNELECERSEFRKLGEKEDEANKKALELEGQLDDKDREVKRLERMIDDVRAECQLQLRKEVSHAENYEKQKADDKINVLTTELNDVKDSYKRTSVKLQSTQTEMHTLKDRYEDLRIKHESTEVRAEGYLQEKNSLTVQLQETSVNLQKTTDERDYYQKILEEKTDGYARVRSENDKLSVQLDEKERTLSKIQHQSENMSHIVELNSKQAGDLREENEKLSKVNRERAVQLEETKLAKDSAIKKLKQRDRQLKDLEFEKERLHNDLKDRGEEVDRAEREREKVYQELKDSRYEVARLSEERDSLKKLLTGQEGDKERERNRLVNKLKETEHDLRLAKKALKSRESIDDKAVKVADKMQSEVTSKRAEIDSLQTKVSWLEECLDVAKKDTKSLRVDNEKLSSALRDMKQRNTDSTSQVEDYIRRNKELRDKILRLEAALEKAAVKHAGAQDQLEIRQQEIAQLKLKHQLDLKDFERTNQLAAARHLTPTEPIRRVTQGNPGNYSIDEVPVSQKPTESLQDDGRGQPAVGDELRLMLNEVKELIIGQNNRDAHRGTRGSSRGSRDSSLERGSRKLHSDNFSEPDVDRTHRVRAGGHKRARKTDSAPTFPNARIPPLWTSSPTPTPSVASSSRYRSGRGSPVEDLLNVHSARSYETGHGTRSRGSSFSHTPEQDGVRGASACVSSDAQVLCRRLEDKLESLSQMGGNLQKENKEMADLIKDQGTRLKKVRESGKHSRRSQRR